MCTINNKYSEKEASQMSQNMSNLDSEHLALHKLQKGKNLYESACAKISYMLKMQQSS